MTSIQNIDSDVNFTEVLKTHSNSGKLILIDFFASWCKPCKRIEPSVNKLSTEFPGVVFLKVDVDKCEETAATYGIASLPTFVFLRGGNRLAFVKSSDEKLLKKKLSELAGTENTDSSSINAAPGGSTGASTAAATPGFMDLVSLLQKANCECLNCDSEHPLEHGLSKDMRYLMSDTDEQLIIFLTFNQVVKLHSMRITAPEDSGPRHIKIFMNQTTTPDFDACESGDGVQEFELKPEDLKSNALVPLKYVKFQNVNSLTIFVKDNQKGLEKTQITSLSLFGNPVVTTNMQDFKRVAGKKGESHG